MRSCCASWCLVFALTAVGCGRSEPSLPPNLLLVTIDTLRADHLGAYGYAPPTSRAFETLAASGALYTRAQATSSWTLPSHASLFTGLYPFEHGAHSFLGTQGRNAYPLDTASPTLAAELREAGYETAAFVANVVYMSPWTGLDRGFDRYEVVRKSGLELNRLIFRWLDAPRERPFFLFVNYMDAHRPYNVAPVARLPSLADSDPALLDRLVEQVLGSDTPPSPELVARVIAQYDLGVANADDALGSLLAALEQRGLSENTVVVVTSDHGEYFGEHDLVEHSKDVYQPVLWIPLVIRGVSGTAPQRVDTTLSLAHLPHLIAQELGPLAVQLTSRFSRAPGTEPVLAESYFARAKDLGDPRWGARFQRVRRVIFEWPWKRIDSSDHRDELYDLAADPGEENDLSARHPEVGQRLDAFLEAQLARASRRKRDPASPAPTPEELEELRALGYVDDAR